MKSKLFKRFDARLSFFGKLFLFLLILMVIGACQSKNEKTASSTSFLVLSDIHFNPFNSCDVNAKKCDIITDLINSPVTQWDTIFAKYDNHQLNTYRDDTSPTLLNSLLNYIDQLNLNYRFVLLTGDYLAHNYQKMYQQYTGDMLPQGYQQFVQKTNEYLIYRLKQTLPNTSVYAVIGNNDSYHGHYYTNPGGPFYKMMAAHWQGLILQPENKIRYNETAPFAGYYAIWTSPKEKNEIVVLNTNLFSTNAIGYNIPIAAKTQLIWLEKLLQSAEANHQHVILVSHIPFGVNANKAAKILNETPVLWQSQYQQQFINLLNRYPGVVTDMVSGHFHMDGFEILHLANNNRLLNTMVPGVSSISGNNPAFKVYEYNRQTFSLINFQTYYLNPDTDKWQLEYDFSNAYQPFCLSCTLLDGYSKLHFHSLRAIEYQKYFAVKTKSQPIKNKANAPYYYCGIMTQTKQDYDQCLTKEEQE